MISRCIHLYLRLRIQSWLVCLVDLWCLTRLSTTLSHNVVSSGKIMKILFIFLSFVDNVTWWCSSKEIFQEGLDKWKTYNNYKQYVAVLWKYQPKRTLVMQLQLEICCWQKSLHICCDIFFNRPFANSRFDSKIIPFFW